MPILTPAYQPPRWLRNGHVQTIAGRLLKRIRLRPYTRRRLELTDGDFLDLDELCDGYRRVAILVHGLESSTSAPYMRSMASLLHTDGWDIVAMNLRGCSGEPNRLLRSYHSGATDDLQEVIDHVQMHRPGTPLALVGFSLGGNMVLRYLGERGEAARAHGIVVSVGISVPCELASCAQRFAEPGNRFYMNRFLKQLFQKVRHRQAHFPNALDYASILASRNFHDFDGQFTAPVHGFDSAQDYWEKCSAKTTASAIAVPTLLINATDDPFLTWHCHLLDEAKDHPHLHAELCAHGGHVAFLNGGQGDAYHENRIRSFIADFAPSGFSR